MEYIQYKERRVDKLISPVIVSASSGAVSHTFECKAMWDTGASITQVSNRVVRETKAEPTGAMYCVDTPAGKIDRPSYLVRLCLPGSLECADLEVIVTETGDSCYDVLIGMDIIGKGDFMLTCYGGKTTFAFRYPPTGGIGL